MITKEELLERRRWNKLTPAEQNAEQIAQIEAEYAAEEFKKNSNKTHEQVQQEYYENLTVDKAVDEVSYSRACGCMGGPLCCMHVREMCIRFLAEKGHPVTHISYAGPTAE